MLQHLTYQGEPIVPRIDQVIRDSEGRPVGYVAERLGGEELWRLAQSGRITEAQIREAVATAAHVRHWSTVLNGMGYDFEAFKAEVDKMHASN